MPNATGYIAPSMGLAGLKTVGALFLVLGLLFTGIYLLRRFGRFGKVPGGGRSGLSLASQLYLGPKKNISVIRFQDKYLILGVTESQISLLSEMDVQDEKQSAQDFSQALQKAHKVHSHPRTDDGSEHHTECSSDLGG